MTMSTPLPELASHLLEAARARGADQVNRVLQGGHDAPLQQRLLVLDEGATVPDADNDGVMSLTVLSGHIEVTLDDTSVHVRTGDHLVIPERRHGLHALERSIAVLTTAPLR